MSATMYHSSQWRVIRLGIGIVILIGLFGWYYRSHQLVPVVEPPEVHLDNVEKPIVAVITRALERVRQDPHSADAWGFLGKVLVVHNFLDESNTCFAQAERLDPKDPRWPYYLGLAKLALNVEEALRYIRRSVELCDQYAPEVVTTRLLFAETLLEQGKLEEAEVQFRIAEKREPDDPRILFNLGLIAAARHEDDKAIDLLTRVADRPEARKKANSRLAQIYSRKNETVKAAEYQNRAEKYAQDESWEDIYVEEYVALDVSRQRRMRQVQREEKSGNYPEALKLVTQIIRDGPDDAASMARANILARMGQYAEAEKELCVVLSRSPDKIQAHYALGHISFVNAEEIAKHEPPPQENAKAKYREALNSLRQAVERKRDHGFALMYMGKALVILGQFEEGMQKLHEAVKVKPQVAGTHLFLGEALEAEGKNDEAEQEYMLAVRFAEKNDQQPANALKRLREKLDKEKP